MKILELFERILRPPENMGEKIELEALGERLSQGLTELYDRTLSLKIRVSHEVGPKNGGFNLLIFLHTNSGSNEVLCKNVYETSRTYIFGQFPPENVKFKFLYNKETQHAA